ncbi:MAG: hypothetical protein IJ813_01200, partial [Bacteroidales bacterium]|nr:hypothetical protein [Bacteroidales bacterium]
MSKIGNILLPIAVAGLVLAQTVGVEAGRAARLHKWFPAAVRDTVGTEADSGKAPASGPATRILKDSSVTPDSAGALLFQADSAAADSLGAALSPADSAARAAQDSLRHLKDSLQGVIDSLKAAADTARMDSLYSILLQLDSASKSPLDSIADEEDFDLFAIAPEDTMPKVYARDTMKVPDSLKLTDPFLYEWYIAVKDSFTHRLVVDSLKAEGDSILWPRIDSLYLDDSTRTAKEKFDKWYAGLSKAERKRYDYQQKLPILMHRQDSILKRKDSIKRVKDSIRQSTPRVLETAFLPDTLYYKRLISWKRDRNYNGIEYKEWDTTANYRFYDYPFMKEDVGATWLGFGGSAVQHYNFFRRGRELTPSFYDAMETWTYSADNIRFFNTKTPYTEWEYYGSLFSSGTEASDAFRIFTTQNILPQLNLSLEMKRHGGAGNLKNEETDNRTYFVTANWLGKKWLAHAGFISNSITRQESGGVVDNFWIRDTSVQIREIDVNLPSATNRYRKTTVFFDQNYRIPFEFIEKLRHRKDTAWVPSDTLNTNTTTAFVGTGTEWSTYSKKYVDNTSTTLSDFYNDVFYVNPSKSTDSLRTMRLDNRIIFRLQPWKEDAIVSKIEGGIGDRLQTFYLRQPGYSLIKPVNTVWNTMYVYAGAEGRLSRYMEWDATGRYHFTGVEANDFSLGGRIKLNIFPFRRHPSSPMTLEAAVETSLKAPDFYQQHFYSNHYIWENDFQKVSTTKIHATFSVPRWDLKAEAGYALLANNVYYDTLGIARQNNVPMSILTAALTKNFKFGPVHLDNKVLFQLSSNQDVVPLPTVALN